MCEGVCEDVSGSRVCTGCVGRVGVYEMCGWSRVCTICVGGVGCVQAV